MNRIFVASNSAIDELRSASRRNSLFVQLTLMLGGWPDLSVNITPKLVGLKCVSYDTLPDVLIVSVLKICKSKNYHLNRITCPLFKDIAWAIGLSFNPHGINLCRAAWHNQEHIVSDPTIQLDVPIITGLQAAMCMRQSLCPKNLVCFAVDISNICNCIRNKKNPIRICWNRSWMTYIVDIYRPPRLRKIPMLASKTLSVN